MLTWKEFLMEKSMEELKEYRRKKCRIYISSTVFMLIPCILMAVAVALGYYEEYGTEVASDVGACFGTGMWLMHILQVFAQLSVINRVIREKRKKQVYSFYGVIE